MTLLDTFHILFIVIFWNKDLLVFMVSGEFILQQSHHSCSPGCVWKSAVLQAKHMVSEKPRIFSQDCLREGFLNEGKFTERSPTRSLRGDEHGEKERGKRKKWHIILDLIVVCNKYIFHCLCVLYAQYSQWWKNWTVILTGWNDFFLIYSVGRIVHTIYLGQLWPNG